jgi:uncharacterized DUF497 family protein
MVEIKRLIWTDRNIAHIAPHGVTPADVEDAMQNDPHISGSRDGTLRIIAPTSAKRMLTIILSPRRDGGFYIVTAHPASRQERRLYQEARGGEEAVS